MPSRPNRPALYASFDRYPSPKGAATHIRHVTRTLFDVAGGGLLYVLGDESLPAYERHGEVEIHRPQLAASNFLDRAMAFGDGLRGLLEERGAQLRICQFRDPWSGVPIVLHPGRHYATIYEVNGLPSIELPYLYPDVGQATLEKVRTAETLCWEQADLLVTPAETIKANLVRLGADPAKILVIPNGADVPPAIGPRPDGAPAQYLLYFGALQAWQGIDVLFEAFALLADFEELHLVICAASPRDAVGDYRAYADELEIAERVIWRFQLSQAELVSWLGHALLTVAPLTECSRNLEQGCAPLKILESMAAGVPVVAADLPPVRELMLDRVHGRLVRPDRPSELARAIRIMLEYPERRGEMGRSARAHVVEHFTWARSLAELADVYRALLGSDAHMQHLIRRLGITEGELVHG